MLRYVWLKPAVRSQKVLFSTALSKIAMWLRNGRRIIRPCKVAADCSCNDVDNAVEVGIKDTRVVGFPTSSIMHATCAILLALLNLVKAYDVLMVAGGKQHFLN